MIFRIAAVSFLNTIPLVEWFATNKAGGHQVFPALPSRMSDLLQNGEADVALLPVAEAFRGQSGGILAGTGIACNGNVDSVKLFCRGPLNQIHKVLADRGSRSSVALVQVLLGELEGIRPELTQIEPRPGVMPGDRESILVIGDRCFEYEKQLLESGNTGIEAHDLGGMWLEMTGLPFIFAVWAIAPGFRDQWGEKGVNTLSQLLGEARDFGLANLDTLAAREAANGCLGYLGQSSPEAIVRYFRESLVYKLGDQEIAGMRRFHELCIRHGLVPDQAMPSIL
jgi:chorismate dehydratase